jgi:hypothetical protein
MFIKALFGTVAALALTSAAQAAVSVQIWTGQPASVTQNATIAQAGSLGPADITATVGGIDFSTSDSAATTIGTWLGNAGISSTILNDSYMLFTGNIFLTAGSNPFTIAHDDGLQLSLDGGIGLVVDTPGPTPPVTTPFTITAPSTGTYNFTMSYGECCGGPAVLQWFYPTGEPVGSVPEPATWAMMLLGFGAIGSAMRASRRKRMFVEQLD